MIARVGSAHVAPFWIYSQGGVLKSDLNRSSFLDTKYQNAGRKNQTHNDCSLPIRETQAETQQGLLSDPGQAWESRV